MGALTIFLPESTPPLRYAQTILCENGMHLCSRLADSDFILLPIPSSLSADLWSKLQAGTQENTLIIGGNLPSAGCIRKTADLLKDPRYLAKNAAITAHCALSIVMQQLPAVLEGCPVLIIGWGRIGAALASDLQKNSAQVTVCSGTEKSRSVCMALGHHALSPEEAVSQLPVFRVIINTAPAPVVPDFSSCRRDCLLVDLASKPGILAPGVINARGLPGKMAPESSGRLIAETVLELIYGKEH